MLRLKYQNINKLFEFKSCLKLTTNFRCMFTNYDILIKNNFIEISDEIKYNEKAIVALESTIITHGLPYPYNLETAIQVEDEVNKTNIKFYIF